MKKEYKSLIYLSIPVILAIILTVKVNISIVNNMPYFPFRLTNLSFSIITMIITLLFFIAFIKKFKNQTWSFLKRYGKELFLLIIALALINKYVIPNLSYAFTFWQLKEYIL